MILLKLKNMRVMIQDTSTNGTCTPLNILPLNDKPFFLTVNNIIFEKYAFLLAITSHLIKES